MHASPGCRARAAKCLPATPPLPFSLVIRPSRSQTRSRSMHSRAGATQRKSTESMVSLMGLAFSCSLTLPHRACLGEAVVCAKPDRESRFEKQCPGPLTGRGSLLGTELVAGWQAVHQHCPDSALHRPPRRCRHRQPLPGAPGRTSARCAPLV